MVTVGGDGERSTVRLHKLALRLSVKDRATGGAGSEIDDETRSWDEE